MPTNAFEFFLGRQNARVVKLLEQNHDVSAALQGLLEHLVSVAEDRGVEFRDLALEDVFVAGDNLRGRIVVKR